MSVRGVRRQTPRQEANALASANLKQQEATVLSAVKGKMRAGKMRLDDTDLEAAYNLGWHGVCQYITKGGEVSNLTGFLIDITHKRAVDIYRQRHEGKHQDDGLEGHGVEVDLAEQVDDQVKLQRLMKRLTKRLNDNERRGVTLCVLHGYKRPEAADMLGIEQAAFQRIMDSAMKKVAGVVAGIDARGCGGDEWARLVRSYAFGLLRERHRDYARVVEHIEDCETCARYVTGLRGLAVVLPPVGLPFMPVMGHEQAILAHLYRVFAGGGGAGGAAAVQTSAGTTGAAAGGGSMIGSVSAGAAAKVAAVAVVVAVIGVKATEHATRHRPAPPVAAVRAPASASRTATPVASPAILPANPASSRRAPTVARQRRSKRRHTRTDTRPSHTLEVRAQALAPRAIQVATKPTHVAQSEFEIEPAPREAGSATSAPSASQTATAASDQGSAGSAQQARAAEREFGPER
jgi:DNA-directed RNA polymerase specialized sigma24 family protein